MHQGVSEETVTTTGYKYGVSGRLSLSRMVAMPRIKAILHLSLTETVWKMIHQAAESPGPSDPVPPMSGIFGLSPRQLDRLHGLFHVLPRPSSVF